MGENKIDTGKYYITNVYSQNFAAMLGNNTGLPIIARTDELLDITMAQWEVFRYRNGKYHIKNVGSKLHAHTPHHAVAKAPVESSSALIMWQITETRVRNTIIGTRTELFWGLAEKNLDSPVILYEKPSLPYTQWIFESVEVVDSLRLFREQRETLRVQQQLISTLEANQLSLTKENTDKQIRIDQQNQDIQELQRLLNLQRQDYKNLAGPIKVQLARIDTLVEEVRELRRLLEKGPDAQDILKDPGTQRDSSRIESDRKSEQILLTRSRLINGRRRR